jgi:hypothetical protein
MHNGADAAQDDATAGKPRFRFERGRDGPHLRRGARLGCPDRVEGRLVGLRDASMGQQRGGDFRHDLDLNAFRNVKRNGHSAALDLIAVILAWTYEKTVRGDYRRYQMAESVCISETRESAANAGQGADSAVASGSAPSRVSAGTAIPNSASTRRTVVFSVPCLSKRWL